MGDVPVGLSIAAPLKKSNEVFLAMEQAFSLARRLEDEVSEFRAASEISRLNQAKDGEWVRVGQHLWVILQLALRVHHDTNGMFDPAFASSPNLTFTDLIFDAEHHRVQAKSGLRLALSGIAKGYIVDQMSHLLRSMGYRNFIINAGGDAWVEDEADIKIEGTNCTVKLSHQAIATSGNYERGPHIVNPQTKQTQNIFFSISVVAHNTTLADAFATGFYAMETGKINSTWNKLSALSLIKVTQDFTPLVLGQHELNCQELVSIHSKSATH